VILVHGLDEPGQVWINLTPVLVDGGFRVWNLFYPNDQPIAESGRLFFEEMILFRKEGPENVSIVAFSMGGLVAREMLTRPEFAYSRSALEKKVPKVAQLIMVGTPNHGSELARFRIFMEFRDQLTHLFTGNYSWLNGILDGAGEAGLDLIPGSAFLEALNARPNPEDVRMSVIAGVMSSTDAGDLERMADKLKQTLPESARDSVEQMENALNSVAHVLGDGIVPVQSAELDGIPLHVVSGTHLSIIRNITEGSQRIPPAVPIIMDYLNTPPGNGSP
jgi:pimeloyl-ACP methyl ester carboxylesterase